MHFLSLRGGRQTALAALAGRRRGHLQLGVLGHHPLETDSDTLDDGQQDGAADGAVADGFGASTHGERATGEETGDDGVPGILLFANALDGAVECAEHAAPDAEVATEYGRAGLDCCDGWRGEESVHVCDLRDVGITSDCRMVVAYLLFFARRTGCFCIL
jgi:hypothetical protein